MTRYLQELDTELHGIKARTAEAINAFENLLNDFNFIEYKLEDIKLVLEWENSNPERQLEEIKKIIER